MVWNQTNPLGFKLPTPSLSCFFGLKTENSDGLGQLNIKRKQKQSISIFKWWDFTHNNNYHLIKVTLQLLAIHATCPRAFICQEATSPPQTILNKKGRERLQWLLGSLWPERSHCFKQEVPQPLLRFSLLVNHQEGETPWNYLFFMLPIKKGPLFHALLNVCPGDNTGHQRGNKLTAEKERLFRYISR